MALLDCKCAYLYHECAHFRHRLEVNNCLTLCLQGDLSGAALAAGVRKVLKLYLAKGQHAMMLAKAGTLS